jgi:hypothetical protein
METSSYAKYEIFDWDKSFMPQTYTDRYVAFCSHNTGKYIERVMKVAIGAERIE